MLLQPGAMNFCIDTLLGNKKRYMSNFCCLYCITEIMPVFWLQSQDKFRLLLITGLDFLECQKNF